MTALLQALDADALSQLMQSVNLHSESAPSSMTPSQTPPSPQQAPAQSDTPEGETTHQPAENASHHNEEDSVSQATQDLPNQVMVSQVGVGLDLLADCPLPFEGLGPRAVACTPARGRRPAKTAAAIDLDDGSADDSRVSSVLLCCRDGIEWMDSFTLCAPCLSSLDLIALQPLAD